MATQQIKLLDRLFKSKDGRVVIWQNPNVPLWGWIVFSVAARIFSHGSTHTAFQRLSAASLFTWAYLEIRSGDSMFRRILGAFIMATIVYGFIKTS